MPAQSFVYGVAVSDYNFVGRQEETRRLMADFEGGINVILMSPRRLGKTSLVKHVCQQIDRKHILPVYVDVFGCKSEYEFYNKLASAVLQQTANRHQLWLEEAKDFIYRLTPKLSFSPDPSTEVAVSLGITPESHSPEEILQLAETIAIKKGKRLIVCIDEFQQIGELKGSEHFQATLRGVWQHQRHVSYCLFGSKHHLMGSIFLNKSMPFYQFGDLIVLDKMPQQTWTDYIVSHFADADKHIDETLAGTICTMVDCYSAYVQQLSWLVFTLTDKGASVTEKQVDAAFCELLNTNEPLFMQLVEPLSNFQMNFLRAVAAGETSDFTLENIRKKYQLGSYSNIARLKKALNERDIITIQRDHIAFTDPVFLRWFQAKMMI